MNPPLFGSLCRCHGRPSLIVRSREGGFVTQNCIETGCPRALHLHELPEIECSKCKRRTQTYINPDSNNYAYRCTNCDASVELQAIVPHWSERFEYFGYGLETDDQIVASSRARPTLDLQEIRRRLQASVTS